MVSKTRMLELVKAFDTAAVDATLTESPALLAVRDERGRNWLHVCCGVDIKGDAKAAEASLATAKVLLRHGLPLDGAAFTEGAWQATPLWYTIGRGRNLALSRHLLSLGCNPNFCLWAAIYNRDLEAIRLLIASGANIEDRAVDESPFLGAVKWSHFESAEELLRLGADPNFQDASGMTALHYMLKKGADKAHFAALITHGARGDIPNADGATAADILRRKKDPDFRAMAERLATG